MRIDRYKLEELMAANEISTLKELAEKAGVTYQTLHKAVSRGSLSDNLLAAICGPLNIIALELAPVDKAEELETEVIDGIEYTRYSKKANDYFHPVKQSYLDSKARADILEAREDFIHAALHFKQIGEISAEAYDQLMICFAAAETVDCIVTKQSIERQQAIEARQLETLRGMASAGLLDK